MPRPTAPRGNKGAVTKPTALKVLHGDRPDRINREEPVPPEAEVTPPESLSEAARVHWDRLAPSLIASGVLTVWDREAFGICCEALARYWEATKLVNGSALLVQGASGWIKNPALQVQAQASADFAAYAGRFGLTPSDRTKIKTEAPGGGAGKQDPSRLLSS